MSTNKDMLAMFAAQAAELRSAGFLLPAAVTQNIARRYYNRARECLAMLCDDKATVAVKPWNWFWTGAIVATVVHLGPAQVYSNMVALWTLLITSAK